MIGGVGRVCLPGRSEFLLFSSLFRVLLRLGLRVSLQFCAELLLVAGSLDSTRLLFSSLQLAGPDFCRLSLLLLLVLLLVVYLAF